MSVRWSPIAVNDKLDEVAAEVEKILAPIEAARIHAQGALELPKLPDYMKYALSSLDREIICTVSRLQYKIGSARSQLPKEVLAKEQHKRELERRLEQS